jgi:hypothetical protein
VPIGITNIIHCRMVRATAICNDHPGFITIFVALSIDFNAADLYQRTHAVTVFAQSRWPMERIVSGLASSLRHASQHASTIAL